MEGLRELLQERAEEGLLRTLKPVSSRSQGKIVVNKKEYIDFSSNDYLGLSGHPKLIEAAKNALNEFGASSSASRLLSGSLALHQALEEKIAAFKGKESALIYNSGYQANVGIISALFNKNDAVFSDRLNHASIIDGIILSGARLLRFQHSDSGHLESLLKKYRNKFKKALIATESVFSMDGDKSPLKGLADLKEKYDCSLFVDEAHATGVFGRNGSGLVEEEGLQDKVDLIMGTFSKALGSFGAYLAASRDVIDYLINTSRGFIYSTALPPAIIAANLAAIDLVSDEPERRRGLLKAGFYLRSKLETLGFQVKGESQIIPLIVGSNEKALEAAEILQDKGYWVLPVRPPTVPEGLARLRFSLSHYHSQEILERLVNDISEIRI